VESILSPVGTSATTGLLYLLRVIVVVENLVEWRLVGETKVLGKNLPSATSSTTNLTCQIRAGTRAATVGSHRLTAWAIARPPGYLSRYSDGVRTGRLWFDCRQCKIFLFSTASRPILEPIKPPIQLVPGALSQRVKRQGREADRSPPSSAEVEKVEAILSLSHISSWRCA
jgi:hypothetical protein